MDQRGRRAAAAVAVLLLCGAFLLTRPAARDPATTSSPTLEAPRGEVCFDAAPLDSCEFAHSDVAFHPGLDIYVYADASFRPGDVVRARVYRAGTASSSFVRAIELTVSRDGQGAAGALGPADAFVIRPTESMGTSYTVNAFVNEAIVGTGLFRMYPDASPS